MHVAYRVLGFGELWRLSRCRQRASSDAGHRRDILFNTFRAPHRIIRRVTSYSGRVGPQHYRVRNQDADELLLLFLTPRSNIPIDRGTSSAIGQH